MAEEQEQYVSLKPSTFVEGGGLLDDAVVLVESAKFVLWDYEGKVSVPVPALEILFRDPNGDESAEPTKQCFSMGKPQDFQPNDDGSRLKRVGAAQSVNMSSNGGLFIQSLCDSGFPEDKLNEDVSILQGAVLHVKRQPAPKRRAMPNETAEQKERRENATVLVVIKVERLPWDKPGKNSAKPVAGKGTTTKPAAGADGGDDDSKTATAILIELLDAAPEATLEKKQIPALVMKNAAFKALTGAPKNRVLQLFTKDDFLNTNGGEDPKWMYSDGQIIKVG